MTPLGQGLLTGMAEVDDPHIRNAMQQMLSTAQPGEVQQTVLDLAATVHVLCGALGDCSNTPSRDVLACLLSR